MKLIETDNKDAAPVHMPWDAGLAALAAGSHDLAPRSGDRGPDMPMAQSPFPGVDPVDDVLQAGDAEQTPNMTGTLRRSPIAPGLPREPEPAPSAHPKADVAE